jgi:AcrR family transcriptional regulator
MAISKINGGWLDTLKSTLVDIFNMTKPLESQQALNYRLRMKTPERVKKSDTTKSIILAAARAAFTKKGYENTTIRMIATSAEVDPALVMRYFGSKEHLFAVAAEFKLKAAFPRDIARDDIGRTLADNYLRLWEGEIEGLPLLLRSAASSEQAADRIREIFEHQTVPLIAAISGETGASRRAGLVVSQTLGMVLCRFILKIPPIANMPREDLVEAIGKTLQRYMTE